MPTLRIGLLLVAAAACGRSFTPPTASPLAARAERPSLFPLGRTTIVATGGSGHYRFAFADGGQRSGPDASLSGGAYQAGSLGDVVDDVVVSDVSGSGNPVDVSIVVGTALTLSPASVQLVPGGSAHFTAAGGQRPYTFGVIAGDCAQPRAGSSSQLDGGDLVARTDCVTPTTDHVVVTDDDGAAVQARVAIAAAISVQPASPSVHPGESILLVASGGSAPYTFAFALHGNESGGQLSAAGEYRAGPSPQVTDRLQVTDALGSTAVVAVRVGRPVLELDVGSEYALLEGDVDGDGAGDIVLVAQGEGTYEAQVIQLRDGVLGASSRAVLSERGPNLVALADLDGDQRADLVISPLTDGVPELTIYPGTPTGTLGAPIDTLAFSGHYDLSASSGSSSSAGSSSSSSSGSSSSSSGSSSSVGAPGFDAIGIQVVLAAPGLGLLLQGQGFFADGGDASVVSAGYVAHGAWVSRGELVRPGTCYSLPSGGDGPLLLDRCGACPGLTLAPLELGPDGGLAEGPGRCVQLGNAVPDFLVADLDGDGVDDLLRSPCLGSTGLVVSPQTLAGAVALGLRDGGFAPEQGFATGERCTDFALLPAGAPGGRELTWATEHGVWATRWSSGALVDAGLLAVDLRRLGVLDLDGDARSDVATLDASGTLELFAGGPAAALDGPPPVGVAEIGLFFSGGDYGSSSGSSSGTSSGTGSTGSSSGSGFGPPLEGDDPPLAVLDLDRDGRADVVLSGESTAILGGNADGRPGLDLLARGVANQGPWVVAPDGTAWGISTKVDPPVALHVLPGDGGPSLVQVPLPPEAPLTGLLDRPLRWGDGGWALVSSAHGVRPWLLQPASDGTLAVTPLPPVPLEDFVSLSPWQPTAGGPPALVALGFDAAPTQVVLAPVGDGGAWVVGPATPLPAAGYCGTGSPYRDASALALRTGAPADHLLVARWPPLCDALAIYDPASGEATTVPFSAAGFTGIAPLGLGAVDADLDGDGNTDLVVIQPSAAGLGDPVWVVAWGDGTGGFTLGDALEGLPTHGSLGTGDIDGDGRVDLVFVTQAPDQLVVMFNRGERRFGFLLP